MSQQSCDNHRLTGRDGVDEGEVEPRMMIDISSSGGGGGGSRRSGDDTLGCMQWWYGERWPRCECFALPKDSACPAS